MSAPEPSASAQVVAELRAAHQLVDAPLVFVDPLAVRVIGDEAERRLRRDEKRLRRNAAKRAAVVARSRLADDEAAAAMARGVRQCVVLGAGLDTFAYRNRDAGMRVFEVDRAETQRWKRTRFDAARLDAPSNLTMVPADITVDDVRAGLETSGFDARQPACVTMLGLAIYLPERHVLAIFEWVASLAAGSTLVFDYGVPADRLSVEQQAQRAAATRRAAAIGEHYATFFDPDWLARTAQRLGFTRVDDHDCEAVNGRYFADRSDGLVMTEHGRRLAVLGVGSRESG